MTLELVTNIRFGETIFEEVLGTKEVSGSKDSFGPEQPKIDRRRDREQAAGQARQETKE